MVIGVAEFKVRLQYAYVTASQRSTRLWRIALHKRPSLVFMLNLLAWRDDDDRHSSVSPVTSLFKVS